MKDILLGLKDVKKNFIKELQGSFNVKLSSYARIYINLVIETTYLKGRIDAIEETKIN